MKTAVNIVLAVLCLLCSCSEPAKEVSKDTPTSNTELTKKASDELYKSAGEYPLEGDYKLVGAIDDSYKIYFALNECDKLAGTITGNYKYAKSSGFLSLEGTVKPGGYIELNETDKDGNVTGYFTAEIVNNNRIEGHWLSPDGSKALPFRVEMADAAKDLKGIQLVNIFTEAWKKIDGNPDNQIDGTYCWNEYFYNDLFEDRPEVARNFGVIIVEQIYEDVIRYKLEAVCGPTYHLAFAEGEGTMQGDSIVCIVSDEPEYECILVFKPQPSQIEVIQSSPGMNCEFGARAYAGGTYKKVLNNLEWAGVEEILNVTELDKAIREFVGE